MILKFKLKKFDRFPKRFNISTGTDTIWKIIGEKHLISFNNLPFTSDIKL